MWKVIRSFATLLVVIAVAESFGSFSDGYDVYNQLEDALVNGNTSSIPNLEYLEGSFFPMQSSEPVCVPIQYSLVCNDTLAMLDDSVSEEVGLEEVKLNLSYLWTKYYTSSIIGRLLLSFSHSGITLRGFEWENSCTFMDPTEIILKLDSGSINCSSKLVEDALENLTSQLKAYVDARGRPKVTNDYRAYALKWSFSKTELNHYDIIFAVYIAIIDIFIICSSLSSSVLYQRLYSNIKGKTNPGYSLFWAIVLLSIIWNIGPSWLVLTKYDYKFFFSIAILIPVQLITALLIKKKSDFPIPAMKIGEPSDNDNHSLSKPAFVSLRVMLSHSIQVVSIWSLLITFTFVMHYVTSIVLSLYIDPLGSLVKLIFVKAVVVCFIINLALLFAVDVITLKCTVSACRENLTSFVWILAASSLFLILLFLFFLLVGVVFTSSQSNNLKSIFTIVPSATLIFASFLGHGLLFPKGVKDEGDPAKEVVDDLEGKTASAKNGDTHISMNENTPLLGDSGSSSSGGSSDNSSGDGVHRVTAKAESVNSRVKKSVAV